MRLVSRAAVFARICAIPSSRFSSSARAPSVDLGVGLHPGAFLAHQQGDDLELRAVRRAELALLGLLLDLAHLAGEDRDDGGVVVARTRALALPRLGHGPPVSSCCTGTPSAPVWWSSPRGAAGMPQGAVRRIPNRAAVSEAHTVGRRADSSGALPILAGAAPGPGHPRADRRSADLSRGRGSHS